MKKSRDNLFKNINRERLSTVENISNAKVQASKSNYNKMEETPEKYKETYIDQEKEDLINRMFFFETQIHYLEKIIDEQKEVIKELRPED